MTHEEFKRLAIEHKAAATLENTTREKLNLAHAEYIKAQVNFHKLDIAFGKMQTMFYNEITKEEK